MSSKGENVGVVLFVLLIVGLVGFFVLNKSDKYNWGESYTTSTPNPYELKFFYELLDAASPGKTEFGRQPLEKLLKGRDSVNYFFLESTFYTDSLGADALLSFVERGNDAFIATQNVPFFLDELLGRYDAGMGENFVLNSDTLKANFYGDDFLEEGVYPFLYRYKDEFRSRPWSFNYDSIHPADDSIRTQLGFGAVAGDTAYVYYNFYALNIGKGKLYIHTEPLLFTNYYLSKATGFEYANKVLGHFESKPLIWDDYQNQYRQSVNDKAGVSASPLRYILSQPPLMWAWYTLVGGVLLFLLFRTKREQRIIPLIPKVQNTSIEFAKSLGTLYHQADSGRFVAREMMKIFDNFNRRHYGINRKENEGEVVDVISRKSRVDQELIKEILVKQHKIIYNPSSRMKEIIPLYQMLQSYYKKASR